MPALLKTINPQSVGAIVQDWAGANTLPPSDIVGGFPAGLRAGGAFFDDAIFFHGGRIIPQLVKKIRTSDRSAIEPNEHGKKSDKGVA
jgi:hypothetical protein